MWLTVPADRHELLVQVLAYLEAVDAPAPPELSGHLSARYVPNDSAANAYVVVRLRNLDAALLAPFEAVMAAAGSDLDARDDARAVRLNYWPARWATTLFPAASSVFVAGPREDGQFRAEAFAETGDIPADLFNAYADGRLFSVEHGIPTPL